MEFTSRRTGLEGVLAGMSLKDGWDCLDAETRSWLLENAGCLILPRTPSAKISQEAREDLEYDQHG
jgi:hypothetical protein